MEKIIETMKKKGQSGVCLDEWMYWCIVFWCALQATKNKYIRKVNLGEKRGKEDFEITKDEADRLQECFQQKEFRWVLSNAPALYICCSAFILNSYKIRHAVQPSSKSTPNMCTYTEIFFKITSKRLAIPRIEKSMRRTSINSKAMISWICQKAPSWWSQ